MLGKTHLCAGICAGAACAAALQAAPDQTAILIAASALGSMVPDLDHRKSKITREAGMVGAASSRLFRHRGILHAPIVYALLAGALSIAFSGNEMAQTAILGACLGELSHLFLDLLNPSGIPLLWPVVRRRISLLPIQTGGLIDRLLGLAALVLAAWFVVRRFL